MLAPDIRTVEEGDRRKKNGLAAGEGPKERKQVRQGQLPASIGVGKGWPLRKDVGRFEKGGDHVRNQNSLNPKEEGGKAARNNRRTVDAGKKMMLTREEGRSCRHHAQRKCMGQGTNRRELIPHSKQEQRSTGISQQGITRVERKKRSDP